MVQYLLLFPGVIYLKINILGAEYTVTFSNYNEQSIFEKRGLCGYHDGVTKNIVIGNIKTFPGYEDETEEYCKLEEKNIMRHEITHAFLHESGLADSSLQYQSGWAKNEEMVDWIALQSPKLFKAFRDADCL